MLVHVTLHVFLSRCWRLQQRDSHTNLCIVSRNPLQNLFTTFSTFYSLASLLPILTVLPWSVSRPAYVTSQLGGRTFQVYCLM